jgi:outer membrane protein, heavy metal efflux system
MESRSQPRIVLAHLLMCVGFLLLCSTISTSIAKADDDLQQKSATLESLIQEALAHSPLIVAARRHWEADTRMPIQEGTLPDPEVSFQNLAVGNPIPGNNLQNSNFAYFGYGFSQEIPFPGKLRLPASLAEKEAESAHEEYQAEQCAIIE